jgi:nucleotide-binding universal stress UspA family protein
VFDRILVAFDGRQQSQQALRTAVEVALRFGSSVTIATVQPGERGTSDPDLARLLPVSEDERPLGSLLEEGREWAIEKGVRSFETVLLRGDAAPAILRYLKESPHDLLVVGTRELPRAQRLLLGSVSARLVTSAPCPVLVVRPAPRHRSS